MENAEKIKKISEQMHLLARQRDELMGAVDLGSDLALESNVGAIPALYSEGKFRELQNVAAMIFNLCKAKSTVQKSFDAALKEHAKMPPGISIPKYWNPADKSFLRFRAPIVVSAQSGVGKSTWTRNLAIHCFMNKTPTVYVTNEDSMAEAIIGMFTIYTMLNTGQSFAFQEVEEWMHDTEKGGTKFKDKARAVDLFADKLSKYISIIEAEYWSMSSIILAIEREENKFGEPVQCALLDYIQLVEPENRDAMKEVRHQMISMSRMWKNFSKSKNMACIMVSQLNDDGRTAESKQFERDAGQWWVIERERDKDTEELSPVLTMRAKKGRRTGTGKLVCAIDGKSGAFIPGQSWKPVRTNLYGERDD